MRRRLVLSCALVSLTFACKEKLPFGDTELTSASAAAMPSGAPMGELNASANTSDAGVASETRPGLRACDGDKACIGAIAREVSVWKEPARRTRIGYLRLGARVVRDESPAGRDGCPGGFYRIQPRGYVCSGEETSLDMNHPILRAAVVRPDVTRPLPYRYAFVRAVAPQYLRVATKDEQLKAEFKLADHLAWFDKRGHEANSLDDGANDVVLPWRTPEPRKSSQYTFGERFGAQAQPDPGVAVHEDNDGFDPLPFWLEGKRQIPNVSTFKVPNGSVFADRVRRHTGLALVGAYKLGPDALNRSFAVTTDLRMVPISKLKPDAASAFHGVELGKDLVAPVAFARGGCDKKKGASCTQTIRISESGGVHTDKELGFREVVALSGKLKRHDGSLYRELSDGRWVKASDVGAVVNPSEWPGAADRDEKWIEVSIENQTLVLWQGKTPVYATLVSTGQDGMGDPKTTKATPRGFFRIKAKHVTATMDSNEKSGASSAQSAGTGDSSGGSSESKPIADEGKKAKEGKEGKGQRRRGEGLFELRDVPYVAYFEAGYALHSAYWHDVFGNARSHGCVNLAPIDALRVFGFSDPPVPEGWHGVVADEKEGTVVYVHR